MATAFLAPADYWWSWGDLVFRWLHVIAGIAWIGSSFYFIALDNHLKPPAAESDAGRGVGGEVWEIHGGGFYRIEKFKVAPEKLPEKLYWFKWEAYTTWLSGFALLVVVYYAHASTFLVDPSVADLTTGEAIVLSIAGLALAWIVYDTLCRTLGSNDRLLPSSWRPSWRWGPGPRVSSSPRVPPTSRSARCSGRSWQRTSSS